MRTRSPLAHLLVLLAVSACADGSTPTAPGAGPELKAGGAATTLTATPASLSFTLPPGTSAGLTAKVQYVGVITAASSNATGCARVSPSSAPASKPAGSSVYIATFTVTPVAVGQCSITLTDKKGQQVLVPVKVEGAVSGGRLVYTSTRDGNLEVYLMGASGSVRLTNNSAGDFDPVLSPDGSKVAFASNRTGRSGIYVMSADGTNAVRLSDQSDLQPAWSPDGSKIVFASYRVDYDAGKSELTTDLWQMNADGTGQVQLTFRGDGDPGSSSPSYSPDGSTIVFILGWQIWSIASDGSNPQPLSTVEDNFSASYSPDGTRIVFSSDRESTFSDVWVMNADGSSPERLTTTNSGAGTPTFSPDGTRIAFGSSRNGNDDVYLINADGTGEVRLTADPAQDIKPKFGP